MIHFYTNRPGVHAVPLIANHDIYSIIAVIIIIIGNRQACPMLVMSVYGFFRNILQSWLMFLCCTHLFIFTLSITGNSHIQIPNYSQTYHLFAVRVWV